MISPSRESRIILQPTGQRVQVLSVGSLSHGRARKRYTWLVRAPTGQIMMVFPMNLDSAGPPSGVPTSVLYPRSINSSAWSPAKRSPKRVQRAQTMQRSRSSIRTGPRGLGFLKCLFSSKKRLIARTIFQCIVLQRAFSSPVADRAIERMIEQQKFDDLFPSFDSCRVGLCFNDHPFSSF